MSSMSASFLQSLIEMKTMRLILFALVLVNIFALYHCRQTPLTVEDEQEKMSLMGNDGIRTLGSKYCKKVISGFNNRFCCTLGVKKCFGSKNKCEKNCNIGSSSDQVSINGEGGEGGFPHVGGSQQSGSGGGFSHGGSQHSGSEVEFPLMGGSQHSGSEEGFPDMEGSQHSGSEAGFPHVGGRQTGFAHVGGSQHSASEAGFSHMGGSHVSGWQGGFPDVGGSQQSGSGGGLTHAGGSQQSQGGRSSESYHGPGIVYVGGTDEDVRGHVHGRVGTRDYVGYPGGYYGGS